MCPISPICPIRPPSDKQRPRCGRCKDPLVVPEDMPIEIEGMVDEWCASWHEAKAFRCFDCLEHRGFDHTTYIAAPYVAWREWRRAEEERLLQEWNKSVAAERERRERKRPCCA